MSGNNPLFIPPIRFSSGGAGAGSVTGMSDRPKPFASKSGAATFNINAGGDLDVAIDLATDRAYRIVGHYSGGPSAFACRFNGLITGVYSWCAQVQSMSAPGTMTPSGTAGDTIGKIVPAVSYSEIDFEIEILRRTATETMLRAECSASAGFPTWDVIRSSVFSNMAANLTQVQLVADVAGTWYVGLERWNRT